MLQHPDPVGQEPGGPIGLLATLHPAIIDGVEAGLVIIDSEFHIRASNRFVQVWVKRTAEEMYGQYCFDVFHQFESVCRDCPATRTFESGETAVAVHTGLDKEGGITHAEITTHPIKDSSGSTVLVMEYVRDISERVRFEEDNESLLRALKESEEKYRAMVENSNDLIWVLDSRGNVIWFNHRAEELSGHSLEDWFGRSAVPLVVLEDVPTVRQVFTDTLAGISRNYEVGVYKKNGDILTLLVNSAPFTSGGGVTGTVSFGKDITDRKHAEHQLRRRNNELEVLHAVSSAVSSSLDLTKVLDKAMDSVLQVMGLLPMGGIFLLDEAGLELHLTAHRGLDDEFVRRERTVRLGDCLCGQAAQSGRLLFSSDSVHDERHSRPSGPEPHAHIVVPLKSHDQVQGVLFLYPPSDYVLTPFEERLFAMVGGQIGIAIENARLYQKTDRQLQNKVAELTAALEVAQREREKARAALEVREEFLSVASHELKTPMTSLRGFVQLATRQLDRTDGADPGRMRQALEVIDEQSDKLTRLISQLLDISRIEAGQLALQREVTDIASLVNNVVRGAEPLTQRHTLVVYSKASVMASVDSLRLEQVIVNLIGNAIKYSPDGGKIEVELSTDEAKEFRIAVTDQGIGISPEHRDRIFDRFYQAHAAGHFGGIGLGLYVSREIVNLHGGHIEIEFPERGGTRFSVVMPLALGNEPKRPEGSSRGLPGRVLVVDDDEAIGRLVHMALTEEGYEVRVAPHGAAALEMVRQWPPDLIILDLRMPFMDGREFAIAYRRTPGPHARVVLVTACNDASRPAEEVEADAYLEKPFDLDMLLDVVRTQIRLGAE